MAACQELREVRRSPRNGFPTSPSWTAAQTTCFCRLGVGPPVVRAKTVLLGTAAWARHLGPDREIRPSFPTERISDESLADRSPNDMFPSFESRTTRRSSENRSPQNGGWARAHGPGGPILGHEHEPVAADREIGPVVPHGTDFRRVPRGRQPKRHPAVVWESDAEAFIRKPFSSERRPGRVPSARTARSARRSPVKSQDVV
jgi:hypothetical protein